MNNKPKKTILLLSPVSIEGTPVNERTKAYTRFFSENNVDIISADTPKSVVSLLYLIVSIYKYGYKNILITMPPFRNWLLIFLPRVNVILDIRDGWSLAMKTGYGGTTQPKPIKAIAASFVEYMAIRFSSLVITCTPGLQLHLNHIGRGKDIVLVANGFSSKEISPDYFIKKTRLSPYKCFVCVGKFSEYGRDKVKKVISKILEKHPSEPKKLFLIGCDFACNTWINEYLVSEGIVNFTVDFLPRMSRKNTILFLSENADYGLSIIRDPNYDFGTKVFDYILTGVPVFNYFDTSNQFTEYFAAFFNKFNCNDLYLYSREANINLAKDSIMSILK